MRSHSSRATLVPPLVLCFSCTIPTTSQRKIGQLCWDHPQIPRLLHHLSAGRTTTEPSLACGWMNRTGQTLRRGALTVLTRKCACGLLDFEHVEVWCCESITRLRMQNPLPGNLVCADTLPQLDSRGVPPSKIGQLFGDGRPLKRSFLWRLLALATMTRESVPGTHTTRSHEVSSISNSCS